MKRKTKQDQINELIEMVDLKTKEAQSQRELANQNAKTAESWQNADKERRIEFAKAFDWQQSGGYGQAATYKTPTWTEIFVEIGKMLNVNRNYSVLDKLESINSEIRDMKTELDGLSMHITYGALRRRGI